MRVLMKHLFSCRPKYFFKILVLISFVFVSLTIYAQDIRFLEKNYTKKQYRIPMRDGKKLFIAVYSPKDISVKYPILLWRTPYSVGPYSEDKYAEYQRHTWHHFAKEGYIIVFQDVRGRFMSEGEFVNMTPYIADKKDKNDIDESSDTYDTIDWLVKNIPNNSGNVGMWGISYPGFYAAMGAIDAHPAVKAVSPQAPIANWFTGDDVHHNGAFCPAANFGFFYVFGIPRQGLVTEWPEGFDYPTPDGYQFFLEIGPIKNLNIKYMKGKIPFWNKIMDHGTYSDFWKSRNSLPHFKNIDPAIMIVGGWFDAENAYGALQTYYAIEKNNPNTTNILVMGPWYHGGWVRSDGTCLGDIKFGSNTSEFYIKNIELPFFNYYLKGQGKLNLPEAYVFETGSNKWKTYDKWPPKNAEQKKLYLAHKSSLLFKEPVNDKNLFDEYISDPSRPVPFTSEITTKVPKKYMVEDQRFATKRPDVMVYKSKVLKKDFTIAGPIVADIFVSTTGTDSDWIVKLIDVFPDDTTDTENTVLGGYQMLLRGEIMRGKFRNSYENIEPMEPGRITNIKFTMNDLNHTFKKGHKIMVQIQSSCFPLFDRSPQKFVNIYDADESDFQKETQRIYFSKRYPSGVILNVVNF